MFVKGPLCAGTIFTTTVLALPVKLCFQRQGTADVCMSFRGALEQTKGAIVNIASMNATLALLRIPLAPARRRRDVDQGLGAVVGSRGHPCQSGRAGSHLNQHQ